MAQLGCFVPAEAAVIPVRDSLLSRIGTGDDMENNVSTFLMEMREVAQVCAMFSGREKTGTVGFSRMFRAYAVRQRHARPGQVPSGASGGHF